jgi:NADH-quinone oxidoreductase subunit E
LISHYPQKVAALLQVLHVVQEQFGYLSPEVIDMVAELLETTSAHVFGTANFYDMYRFEPPTKHQLIICRNISCYLHNCEGLKEKLMQKLNIGEDGRSEDGRFTLTEAECLAACDKAPVLMVDEKLYEHVDINNLPKPLVQIMERK